MTEHGLDPKQYVGLPIGEATELALGLGWSPRELAPDAITTKEYVFDRVNLVVGSDGIVLRAYAG